MRRSPWGAVSRLVAITVLLAGCASAGSAVTLLVSSNAPVKGTSTQLSKGTLQAVRDWADAKARIEDIHIRRVAEMLAIEGDAAFLEGVARIDTTPRPDSPKPDPGRLQTLLGIKADDPTFDERVEDALRPPRRVRQPETYFQDYLAPLDSAARPPRDAVFTRLWIALRQATGDPTIQNGATAAAWIRKNNYATWASLITRFAREDTQRGTVVNGADLVELIRARARELNLDPPAIATVGAVTQRAIDRLRDRRQQFPKVERLLSSVNTIARDMDTYLQNDADAIHWKELGEALGKAQDVSTRFSEDEPR